MPLYRMMATIGSALAAPVLYVRSAGEAGARRSVSERLGGVAHWPPTPAGSSALRPRVWVQAVSVGEVRVAETFLRALREREPEIEVALSSTTSAGLERARRLAERAQAPGAAAGSLADRVFAFPLDAPALARRTLSRVGPAAYGSIETEIWPGLLGECRRRGVPAFIVNGSISERSAGRYRWIAGAVRSSLGAVRAACMQSEQDAGRLVALGAPSGSVVVTGSLKFDAAPGGFEEKAEDLRRALGIERGAPVLIAGSTSPGEERIVVEAWLRLEASHPRLTLIVAPRHRERFEAAAAEMSAAGAVVRRRTAPAGSPAAASAKAILLDTIGELEPAYALAQVAFVGGSLVPRGGQNPIEPARLGVPVLFGPGMENFAEEARALIERGAAFEVRDAASLAESASRLLGDDDARRRASEAACRFVQEHAGATRRTLEALAARIPEVFH